MKKIILFLSTCVIMVLQSCSHDIIEPINTVLLDTTGTGGGGGVINPNPCDQTKLYFVNDVLPIFLSSCAYSGCHDAASAKEGIILDTYANIMSTGEVIPGNAWSSKIYEAITETDPEDIMPPSPKPHLLPEQITIIARWINEGALNTECISENCDTLTVKYSTHIEPLITTFCRGCHSGSNPSGGIFMDNYSNVKLSVMNGSFLGSIKREAGWSGMPKNGTKLSDCNIRKIEIWIQNGALNN